MTRTVKFNTPFQGNSGYKDAFNDSLRLFDSFIHPLVLDKDLTAPPGGESTGDTYIVGGSATGAWSGKDNDLAVYYYGNWYFLTPWKGVTAYVDDESAEYFWNGSAWVDDFSIGGNLSVTGTLSVTSTADFGSYIDLNPIADPTHTEGRLWYSSDTNALSYYNDEANVTMQLGRETWMRVYNDSGAQIDNGKAVYISGNNVGTSLPTIALARADALATAGVVGLATHDIGNNEVGYVTINGVVNGINTVAFNNGDTVFLDPSTAGNLTATKPARPNFIIEVGIVTFKSAALGEIEVRIEPGLGSLYPEANTVGSNTEICYFNSNSAVASDANFTWDGSSLAVTGSVDVTGSMSATTDVTVGESIYQTEAAAAGADTAGDGQWWVKNETPNVAMFTDDAGTDHRLIGGTQQLWIPARLWTPDSGAAAFSVTTMASGPLPVLSFDPSTTEYSYYGWAPPLRFNGGTITFRVYWSLEGAGTNAVVWELEAGAYSNDDSINNTFGSASVTDNGTGADGDLQVSDVSGAITIGNSYADGDLVKFTFFRNATAGGDTATADAHLIGVKIFWTSDTPTDD